MHNETATLSLLIRTSSNPMAMPNDGNRLAQVFIWKEGSAPDLQYARQILEVVNPEAARALESDNSPIRSFAVGPPWPRDPWARAIADLHSLGSDSAGASWADTSRYDLAGWQGSDRRTGEHIFVVTAYDRAPMPTPGETAAWGAPDIHGEGVATPLYARGDTTLPAVANVPYDPQRPTGPLTWPPVSEARVAQPAPGPLYAAYDLATRAFAAEGSPAPAEDLRIESYQPYYAGFGERIAAGLADFFFMSLCQLITVAAAQLSSVRQEPELLGDRLPRYFAYACLALLIFSAYHVVQLGVWGQTLGKKLAGIKVVAADGSVPGWGRALLRVVGYFFSLSIGGWGVAMIVLDPRRQALHDKIAGTFVVPERVRVPVPAGLPGYPTQKIEAAVAGDAELPRTNTPIPALGMARVGSTAQYNQVQIALGQIASGGGEQGTSIGEGSGRNRRAVDESAVGESIVHPVFAEGVTAEGDWAPTRSGYTTLPGASFSESDNIGGPTIPNLDSYLSGSLNEATLPQAALSGERERRERPQATSGTIQARALFRQGLEKMESGVSATMRGYKVDPGPARDAAGLFKQALDLATGSVLYRYFYAIALRYSEGFEVAISELRQVLNQDPTHYEARQQVAYGPRWHDAFAYPAWVSPSPVNVGDTLPEAVRALLPPGQQPATRLVLLREGGIKVAAFLSRTPQSAWRTPPTLDMPTRLQLYLSRTPYGPILALYIVVQDDAQNPYIGETFLNPHDPGMPSEDACLLGQNMLEQIARQDRTYLIFADEADNLLLSRKLVFDATTQVSTARMLYEVQSLPPQVMDHDRFRQAAQWHMDHFSLDQVRD